MISTSSSDLRTQENQKTAKLKVLKSTLVIHGWKTFRKSIVGHFISVSYRTSTLITVVKNLTKARRRYLWCSPSFSLPKTGAYRNCFTLWVLWELFFLTIVNRYFWSYLPYERCFCYSEIKNKIKLFQQIT